MVITSMISCNEYNPDGSYKIDISSTSRYYIVKIDSCEYIYSDSRSRPTHKGNCKYCTKRRKQELKKLVEELKKK